MDLLEIRKELDILDREIVHLFEKRMSLVEDVARFKLDTGKAVLDSKREKEKLQVARSYVEDSKLKESITELFQEMMSMSRRKQIGMLLERGRGFSSGFRKLDCLPFSGKSLVYQGAEGAYSYLAGRTFFQKENMIACTHFQEVLSALEEGRADYAILPMENSTYGMVQDNFDLLAKHPKLYVVQEIEFPVSHCLATLPGESFSDIKRVYSHPQALSQCADFFQKYPEILGIPSLNTAIAAKNLMETGEKGAGVLCSREAALEYGLSILEENLSKKENSTRFFILGKEAVFSKDAGKLSISFSLPHAVGSLYHILGNFLFNGLTLTMIQSRPVGDGEFSYRFYVDFLGNLEQKEVLNALSCLQEEGVDFRVLGNYPSKEFKR